MDAISVQKTLKMFDRVPGEFLVLLNAFPIECIVAYPTKLRTGEFLNGAEILQLAGTDDGLETTYMDVATRVDGAYPGAKQDRKLIAINDSTAMGKAMTYLAENARATLDEFAAGRRISDNLILLRPLRDNEPHGMLTKLKATLEECEKLAVVHRTKRQALAAEAQELKADLENLTKEVVTLDQKRLAIYRHTAGEGSGVRRTPGLSSG
ncbi:hypothetical protein B0I37DRAFT_411817 [Chaetomium sp. MPI-CAGE-AT-0009]|nr:hypothetical protein B0I37DRAFT_411817 [Chaetomium sp. MPI-CAGE-AT-0009]